MRVWRFPKELAKNWLQWKRVTGNRKFFLASKSYIMLLRVSKITIGIYGEKKRGIKKLGGENEKIENKNNRHVVDSGIGSAFCDGCVCRYGGCARFSP